MSGEALHRRWIADHGGPQACPYCKSQDTVRTAAFGPFHMTEPYMCRSCGSPFSRIRWRSPDAAQGPADE